jgi:transcriptional regulator with XRE-family HTH domain
MELAPGGLAPEVAQKENQPPQEEQAEYERRRELKLASERLKGLRQRLMLTQSELGERAGVSLYTVNAAEGGRSVSPKTGRALAQALGVEPEELLEESDLPKAEPSPPEEGDERWRAISQDFVALVESLDERQLRILREWREAERIRLGISYHDNPDSPAAQKEFGRAVEQLTYLTLRLFDGTETSKESEEAQRRSAKA